MSQVRKEWRGQQTALIAILQPGKGKVISLTCSQALLDGHSAADSGGIDESAGIDIVTGDEMSDQFREAIV